MADLKKLSQVQPIAQTFQIPFGGGSDKENANFDGGAFVTSVDLFFFGKDEELDTLLLKDCLLLERC